MAAKTKAAKAGAAAAAVKDNQYVQRLVEDDELRGNLIEAYDAVRDAYARLASGKAPHKAIFDDKKVQKDLREAATSLRDAATSLREGPQSSHGGGAFKALLLLLVGTGLAVGLSEGLRKKVLDALFGAEEEFEYTSTGSTTPAGGAAPSPSENGGGAAASSGSSTTSGTTTATS